MSWTARIGRGLAAALRAGVGEAHCDIPCGIYDPHAALLAAKTVHTMVTKLEALPTPGPKMAPEEEREARNSFARMVAVKEVHAQLCKQELLILWSDFFTEDDARRRPELHASVWKAVKLCSANKQQAHHATAQALLDACEAINRLFQEAQLIKSHADTGLRPTRRAAS
ncbi:MAG: superoxide dismutase, Ni [Candidatus Omnitrophica bacterium]|nr:superoxide dismutase, Ni [Candidatus Omnitrophota bacterium]